MSEPMSAGRELDALVAERVMQRPTPDFKHGGMYDNRAYEWPTDNPNGSHRYCAGCQSFYDFGEHLAGTHPHFDDPDPRIPPYSTSIAAVWKVVEKLRAGSWVMEYSSQEGNVVSFWERGNRSDMVQRGADSLPHAICLAALASVPPATEGT